ncbi:Periplasmic murein peptide-binding protein precursor [Planctomycetes bacterium Pan216]|uniref:Periplasmic murein peptide-binding protein n=1 Tax=Kolteria novifilia TaxID=2527975 RepID=A0A518B232_9BACT|nr:Periplasmic murein peptide-binding protein precursor [Planctomycetes bacterium Pan216]
MYRNLLTILAGCGLLLGVFALSFQGSSRTRADYVWNNGTEPQTLDPGKASGQPEGELLLGLFETLTVYDPFTLKPVQGVAKSWESEDGLTHTFHLRPDAWWVQRGEIFQVDGKPRNVTAHDFVYAWQRQFYPEVGSEMSFLLLIIEGTTEYQTVLAEHWEKVLEEAKTRGVSVNNLSDLEPDYREAVKTFRQEQWDRLVGVNAIDDLTLEVTLKSPAPFFLSVTSFYVLAPVCREIVETKPDSWTHPDHIVTNGPYYLDQWRYNEFVSLKKNPNYWETSNYVTESLNAWSQQEKLTPAEERQQELWNKLGSFDEHGMESLEALALENDSTALNMYLYGNIDRVRSLPSELLGPMVRAAEKPGAHFPQFHHGVLGGYYYYAINLKLPVFKDPEHGRKLRLALALTIDRTSMVENITRGGQKPAYSIVPPGVPGYPDYAIFGSGDFSKDVARARELVEEVRAAGVKIPRLRILYNTFEGHAKIAAYIQSNWREYLGIDVTPTNQEWGVYLDSKRTSNFDIVRAAWIGDHEDPSTFLDMYTTENQNNDPRYHNPLYDRLILDYSANILRALETPTSRDAILNDVRNWPHYDETIARRKLPSDDKTLAQQFEERIEAFAKASEEDKLEKAMAVRLTLFRIAEEILMWDMPTIPIYFYTSTQLWPPELEGMAMNIRDSHPLKMLRWKDGKRPTGTRYQEMPKLD